jgi:hypothetical protein
MHGDMRNMCKMLFGKPEWRKIHGYRWEDNIKMDLREMVWENVDWIHVAHDWY